MAQKRENGAYYPRARSVPTGAEELVDYRLKCAERYLAVGEDFQKN